MASRVQHTIKYNVTLVLNVPLSLNKGTLVNYKKKDGFNKVYDSDREPGPFYDMEYFEDTQDSYEYALPVFSLPDAGIFL